MGDVLNLSTLDQLSELQEAAKRGKRVRWAVGGDADVICEGVARHFTVDDRAFFLNSQDDVRDALLRISGTMEYFLPVREVLALMSQGLFYIS